jgi:hypothetical protein
MFNGRSAVVQVITVQPADALLSAELREQAFADDHLSNQRRCCYLGSVSSEAAGLTGMSK